MFLNNKFEHSYITINSSFINHSSSYIDNCNNDYINDLNIFIIGRKTTSET